MFSITSNKFAVKSKYKTEVLFMNHLLEKILLQTVVNLVNLVSILFMVFITYKN